MNDLRQLASSIEALAREHPCWSQVHEIIYCCTNHINALARISEINQKEAFDAKPRRTPE